MSQVRTGAASASPEDYDVNTLKNVDKLHAKAVGLIGVLFLTVTGAAPISAMLGNVPVAVGSGNGIYAPAGFLLATIILTVFSIGYAAMAGKVSSVGGFYSFISHGLGREIGLAAGLSSLVAYSIFESSLYGLFAYFGNAGLKTLTGQDIPWIYFALFAVVAASILSFFDVKISSAILGIALLAEVAILLVFDYGVFIKGGSAVHISAESLNVLKVFSDVAAHKTAEAKDIAAGVGVVGIFMAFWSWVGFEMAPNYAEESRDPKRIVPLSLFLSVIALGVFYTITSWAAVAAYPSVDNLLLTAQTDSGNLFITPLSALMGAWAANAMSVLILTSSFACGMAFHNTASRYFYSLGREGVLPADLGKTHPTYRSPYIASILQSVLAAIWIIAFGVAFGFNDPNAQAYLGIYGMYAILGTMLVLVLQAVVSLAIILYFQRNHPEDAHWWSTGLAPAIAFVSQLYLVYVLITQLEALGGTGAFGHAIPYIGVGVIVVGLLWAVLLRMAAPATFARIGRLVNDG